MTIYIASGDFLTRNTERRVEVGVRVDDREIAKKLRGILDLQLRDTVNLAQIGGQVEKTTAQRRNALNGFRRFNNIDTHDIAAGFRQQALILLQRARIAVKIFIRAKLNRVHENADHNHIA